MSEPRKPSCGTMILKSFITNHIRLGASWEAMVCSYTTSYIDVVQYMQLEALNKNTLIGGEVGILFFMVIKKYEFIALLQLWECFWEKLHIHEDCDLIFTYPSHIRTKAQQRGYSLRCDDSLACTAADGNQIFNLKQRTILCSLTFLVIDSGENLHMFK